MTFANSLIKIKLLKQNYKITESKAERRKALYAYLLLDLERLKSSDWYDFDTNVISIFQQELVLVLLPIAQAAQCKTDCEASAGNFSGKFIGVGGEVSGRWKKMWKLI